MKIFGNEPAVWVSLIAAVLVLLVSFGIKITEDQVQAILQVVQVGLIVAAGVIIRNQVVTIERLKQNNINPATDLKKHDSKAPDLTKNRS